VPIASPSRSGRLARGAVPRVLDADPPGRLALAAQRQHVAADVDEGVADAAGLEDGGGAVERVALAVAAQVELHGRVAAGHGVAADAEVGHLRAGRDEGRQPRRVGPVGREGVGVEAPQGDQLAEGRVEQLVAGGGELLGVGEHRGELGRDRDALLPAAMASLRAVSSDGSQAW
jgi:hypothetical protein